MNEDEETICFGCGNVIPDHSLIKIRQKIDGETYITYYHFSCLEDTSVVVAENYANGAYTKR